MPYTKLKAFLPMPLNSNASLKDWLVVVPARLKSERLPKKPLADLGGMPMIVRVVKNLAPLSHLGAEIIVATDADEVVQACKGHQLAVVMTDPRHASGTDRAAEVALKSAAPYILNVQGDEPFVDTDDLKALMVSFMREPQADMGTLVYESSDQVLAGDPNAVKAVRSTAGFALYFSRASLPYNRDKMTNLPDRFWHHLGVYAFRRDRLADFVKLGPSTLERQEKLEQLRALEAGWRIWLEPARHFSRGIDTIHDLEAARARLP